MPGTGSPARAALRETLVAPGVVAERLQKNIGELWEAKSGGKALFLWAVKKDDGGCWAIRAIMDRQIVRQPSPQT